MDAMKEELRKRDRMMLMFNPDMVNAIKKGKLSEKSKRALDRLTLDRFYRRYETEGAA